MQFAIFATLAAAVSAYTLRCNGAPNELAIHDRTAVVTKLLALSGSTGTGGAHGHHLIEECGSSAPQCVRVTLRSESGRNVQDTKRNIAFAVQQISDACGQGGGSGPSLGEGELVVHVARDWV